jgi:hypothetical protein
MNDWPTDGVGREIVAGVPFCNVNMKVLPDAKLTV